MIDYKLRKNISLFFCYLFLTIFAFMAIYPLWFSLITSLKTSQEYTFNKLGFPVDFTFTQFYDVLYNYNMLQYLWNSVLLVFSGLILYMFICTSAGFAFGKLQFRGRYTAFTLVLFLQIFPQMVIASQLYQIASKMGLLNTHIGMILIWVAYFAPFGTYIMTTYYSSVPKELVESARMDGANVYRQLFHIMIPVAKPMLGTIGIVGALAMWNELPFAMLVLQTKELRTLILGIALMQGEFGLPIPTYSAAIIVSATIPLVIYLFFQNQITMGSVAGSVKG